MNTPVIYKYPLDITGTSITNYVSGELHVLSESTTRLLVFRSGPFFTESVKLYNWETGEEYDYGKHYGFLCMYEEATLACASEIATVIEIKDDSLMGRIGIDAQVVGGEFSYNQAVIMDLLLQTINDNRQINWDDITNKPELFRPAPHMHLMDTDIYGTGPIVKALNHIDEAIALRNVREIILPIQAELRTKVSKYSTIKVGLENAIFRPTDAANTGICISLPKSPTGAVDCVIEFMVTQGDQTMDCSVSFTEAGADYENVVFSRDGNSDSFWAMKMSSYYVTENTIELSSAFIREDFDITQCQFIVKSYMVASEENSIKMTAEPAFLELPVANGTWVFEDVVYPDVDQRDFVERMREVMLEPTRSFVNFEAATDATVTWNNGDGNCFGIKFPVMNDTTSFKFVMEVDVRTDIGQDIGVFKYWLQGTYFNNQKFTLDAVSVDGQPSHPLQVYVSNAYDDAKSNYFVFKDVVSNSTVTGSATIRSMTVSNFDRAAWIEDWGVVLNPSDVDEGIDTSTITYGKEYTEFHSVSQRNSGNKTIIRNGHMLGTEEANATGLSLALPALDNGESIVVNIMHTVQLDDGTTQTAIYRPNWTGALIDLNVAWAGHDGNPLKFHVEANGSLQIINSGPWEKSLVNITAINVFSKNPENYPDDVVWSVIPSETVLDPEIFVTPVEPSVPVFQTWVEQQLVELTETMNDDLAKKLSLDGSNNMSGLFKLAGNGTDVLHAATVGQLNSAVSNLSTTIATMMPKAGGTFTGIVKGVDPVEDNDLVTKRSMSTAITQSGTFISKTKDDSTPYTVTAKAFHWTSDRRIKDDIKTIENSLDKIKGLDGCTYIKNGEGPREAGLIAQDVNAVLPEGTSELEDGTMTVSPYAVIALLVNAVKEQQVQIDQLTKEVRNGKLHGHN